MKWDKTAPKCLKHLLFATIDSRRTEKQTCKQELIFVCLILGDQCSILWVLSYSWKLKWITFFPQSFHIKPYQNSILICHKCAPAFLLKDRRSRENVVFCRECWWILNRSAASAETSLHHFKDNYLCLKRRSVKNKAGVSHRTAYMQLKQTHHFSADFWLIITLKNKLS